MGALGSISYLGQLQDPLQCPPHLPQLGVPQHLLVLQQAQVVQAPLPAVPARLRQPWGEDGLVPGPSLGKGSLHPSPVTLVFLLLLVVEMMLSIGRI